MNVINIRHEIQTWSDLELLSGLIVGEAEDQSWEGRVLVAMCAMERSKHPGHWNWGRNLREIILAPTQFSCFQDSNIMRIIHRKREVDYIWRENSLIAHAVYTGMLNDMVKRKPTHYHGVDVHPSWAKKIEYLYKVGDHLFYTCFGS